MASARMAWALPALLALVMTQCAVVPRVAQAQATQAAQAPSLDNGKMIFESRCIACHSLDANRIGPALQGVVGRQGAYLVPRPHRCGHLRGRRL